MGSLPLVPPGKPQVGAVSNIKRQTKDCTTMSAKIKSLTMVNETIKNETNLSLQLPSFFDSACKIFDISNANLITCI